MLSIPRPVQPAPAVRNCSSLADLRASSGEQVFNPPDKEGHPRYGVAVRRFEAAVPQARPGASIVASAEVRSCATFSAKPIFYAARFAVSWFDKDGRRQEVVADAYSLETGPDKREDRLHEQEVWRRQISAGRPTLTDTWQAEVDALVDQARSLIAETSDPLAIRPKIEAALKRATDEMLSSARTAIAPVSR